ncbi:glutathione peroxidase [Methylomagnum ishizawai]|uniref:glutathione peroxidase n=1 Tax=Methylomagnum ishizawai TaxID=1760988 RepID=UPI001C323783|nr:glutathione peroxidase [Methylomagnum ishizawai]BBL76445.1 glutathione peroxidase [Methylomagnum ishizawai]
MRIHFPLLPWLLACALALPTHARAAENCPPLLDYTAKPLRGGEPVQFCEAYRGKVVLAVNTASQCGFTPQFKGLEALYQKYKDKGLVVLGFPSNDFWQEFSEADKTAEVCYLNYGVTFPMFAKSPVKGADANPFFKQLAGQSGTSPKWNFFKYLIDRNGKVVEAYASTTTPDDKALVGKIEALLGEAGK